MRKSSLGASAGMMMILVTLLMGLSFTVRAQEADPIAGKKLFNANCAACHKLNKKAVGPALRGVSAKYEKEWLYSWIKNSAAMIKAGDAQAVAIWEEYNKSAMNAFPQLSNEDIDNIIAYTTIFLLHHQLRQLVQPLLLLQEILFQTILFLVHSHWSLPFW